MKITVWGGNGCAKCEAFQAELRAMYLPFVFRDFNAEQDMLDNCLKRDIRAAYEFQEEYPIIEIDGIPMIVQEARDKLAEKSAGRWEVHSYQSGTFIVSASQSPDLPHFYVYAEKREKVAGELALWFNGGERPQWAGLLMRETSTTVKGPEGIHILAVGPMILPPEDDGKCDWIEAPEKLPDRRELIDTLFRK